MAFVEINPQYREVLARQGLVAAADFLALHGIVCCGHPDRHVARVTLGTGTDAVPAFLKREHRIRWRDRLANAWAGFGFVSKSRREFAVLRLLETTGIGSPQGIAVGEDDDGRAFLLVRELEGGEDLRPFLGNLATAPFAQRRNFARQLGKALAYLHNAGFDHPDLYSKHVLIRRAPAAESVSIYFLDWQRSWRRPRIGGATRWRDLAALDATLAEELATPRDRLRVLHAYLKACGTPLTLALAAREIHRRALRLLQRRRIREMRQPPLAVGTQNLIWLDGEAMQVTREFRDELGGQLPNLPTPKKKLGVFSENVQLPGAPLAHLVTRGASRPWRWLWSWLRRQPLVAPELESMKVHFRLQRYGVVLPRLLAAGQKNIGAWEIQSFLLTEPLHDVIPLPKFLLDSDRAKRHQAVRRAARVLRQMHQATCYVDPQKHPAIGDLLTVASHGDDGPAVALATVHGIEKSHYPHPVRAQRDLAALMQALTPVCSRTDLLRALLQYTGQPRLSFATKSFARRVLHRLPAPWSQRRIAA